VAATQKEKGEALKALHEGEPFVIPNPWDAGTAQILAALGFKALATTSAGLCFRLGRTNRILELDEVLANITEIDGATDLPVSADLENGYGPEPEDAANAITRAAEAGAVGGSIEDWDHEGFIYELPKAAERVAAAVEAARALDFPFALVGRAENFFRG
jgi:2-methylisocitrate lyase-like PEP mutase family enzyme